MSYADIDGALLLALKALLAERNVTHAAGQLGITQSTLSGRLNRLRDIFGDALFVPAATGRGVVPTPRAEALERELNQVLDGLKRMVEAPAEFDPAASTRSFVVAVPDGPAAALIPGLSDAVLRAAPRGKLAFVQPAAHTYEQLEQGGIDLLVAMPEALPGDFVQRPLWEDDYLTAQRKGHPRGARPIELDEYCALDHLIVSPQGGRYAGGVDDALLSLGRSRNVAVSIQSYGMAPVIVGRTDCICTLPARFLRQFDHMLDLFEPPVEMPAKRLSLAWHPRSSQDAGHRWLRRQVYSVAGVRTD